MTSKADKERQKQVQDKCQALLTQMLRDDDNKYCVDCDTKGPRWASWNLGVFLCIRCAGIHRNLGVHISRVKSVTLDSWTPEQVVSLQMMGNSRARAVYEANLPDNFRRPHADSALEAFVRAKYEAKKYIAKEWVQPPLPTVNWDKEFEEEAAERIRKRKKQQEKSASVTTKSVTPVATRKADGVVPQPLPKPNASPKSQRHNAASSILSSSPSKPSTDLLGLDSSMCDAVSSTGGDDMFTSFLSAPVAGGAVKRTPEEESFFNQPVATEKKQLTTDSILALYAKTPAPATGHQQPPLVAATFGQGAATTAQGFLANTQQMPGGFQPQPANGMIAGMQNTMHPMMVNQSNPFYNMGGAGGVGQPHINLGGPAPATALHQQMSAMSLSQAQPNFGAFVQSQQMVPTFPSSQNFQAMQFNMSSNPTTIPGPTLSSNLS